jgi:Transposase, Mutator family.
MKYVASKNQKAFMKDLKPVYRAASKEAAETALDQLEEKWGDTYPHCHQVLASKMGTLIGLL